jgi:two-component system response regulator YesN
VDDEAIIADGLTEILGGLGIPGLDVCKAYSGIEALEWLDRTRVDIVLSDIRMPELDGLELMERIRRKWPRCKIIFLTGYNDFESVYKAIRTTGIRYLLKTEGYAKVTEEVRAAISELDEEWRTDHLLQQAKEQRNTLETLAQGDYFRHLLLGSETNDPEERGVDFRRLAVPLDSSRPVLLVLGSILKSAERPSYAERQEMALAVKLLADRYLQDHTAFVGFIDRYGDPLWLIQPLSDVPNEINAYEDAVRFLEGTLELVQEACSEALDTEMAFTVSGFSCAWDALPAAYDRIRQLQHVRIGDGASMVLTAVAEPPETAGSSRELIRAERFEVLAGHLESGRRDAFFSLLKEIVEPVQSGGVTDKALAIELYYSAALMLLSYINRRHMHDQTPVGGLMLFDAHATWEEGFRYLEKTAEALFAHRRRGEGNRAAGAMQEIGGYIEKHLEGDLSLVGLSKRFHFNPSYLSRVFKQESGLNLSEYIDKARIRKAKELLAREGLKIHEIGVRVGYEAPHSFTRFFKKSTGMTPQEYREATREAP